MTVVERKPVPIYASVCPECGSKIAYRKSEVGFAGCISCPVCNVAMNAMTIYPVRYEYTEES